MKLRKVNQLFLTATFAVAIFLPLVAFGQTESIESEAPQPRVSIPGVQFTAIEKLYTLENDQYKNEYGNTVRYVPFIGEYIAAVYKYAILAASILALVMIVIAGFQWTASGGNTETIGQAKKRINGALIGLMIAVGSYTLLYSINPELIQFRALKVDFITARDLSVYEINDGGDEINNFTGESIPTNLDEFKEVVNDNKLSVECPGAESGLTQNDLPRIARSFVKNVTYAYGSSGRGTKNQTCPAGTICLDCSGYIQKVYQCAGMKAPQHGTKFIFDEKNGAERIRIVPDAEGKESYDIDYDNATVNGVKLEYGDLLGWKQDDGFKFGHVVMYIDQGEVIDSTGESKKINANVFVRKFNLLKNSKTYTKFRWVLRHKKIVE